MKIDIKNLEKDTIAWASDRGIIQHSSPQTQCLKLMSEVGELADNLIKGADVTDDIGDCLVVLTLIANMKGTTLTKCFNHAWNDIKDRKGIMSPDGAFVKESDVRYKQLVMEFDNA